MMVTSTTGTTEKVTSTTGGNLVPLDAALREKFQEFHRNIRKNTIALAREAFQIHNQHWLPAEKNYDKEFRGWWKTQGLDEVFGGISAWSKWHSAGAAIEEVHARYEKYADRLPVARDALYEISQLDAIELRLCLENTYKRTSVTQDEDEWQRPKKPRPVINPGATAASIRNWRKNWRQPPKPRTEKRTLPFITIHVHGSLYDFDKSGNPTGQISPKQITDLNAKIVQLSAGKPLRRL